MTLQIKLLLSIAIVIILSIVIGITIFTTTQYVNKANEARQKSDKTVKEIFQLTILLNEYLMHHEERAANQWQLKHKTIQDLLSSQNYSDPKNQAILSDISKTHASTADNFSRLAEAYQNKSSEELQNKLTSILLVKSQSMVSKSVVLSDKSYAQQEKSRRNALIILATLIGTLVLSTTTLFLLLYKSIVSPIAKLNKATQLIAAGNWDHKVDIKNNDEIGQLAQAFNTMTAKINSYIAEQKQGEKQKDDFIAAASHELKTPLTSLILYTQLLHNKSEKTRDTQSKDILQKMTRQINKLLHVVSDLLDVQKIVGGKLRYSFDFFNLNELVNETLQEMQVTTENHKIISKLAKDITVYGSRMHIGQVLTNLISNAIKYSSSNRKIMVSTAINDTEIIISVQDFGIGIIKEDQEKVFERFYRVGGTIEKTYPGLGLGLYIASQIIEQHRGKIWVKSQKDKGSTFFFSLPLKKPQNS